MRVVESERRKSRGLLSRLRRDDGLPPGPPLPELAQLGSWLYRPFPFLRRCRERYGPVFSLRFFPGQRIVAFTQPDPIKEIFTGPSDILLAGRSNQGLEPIVGAHSLLLLDGPRHLRERKLLLPPFHGARMRAYGRTMHAITEEAMERFPVGRPFEIHGPMQAITLEVILRTVFGVEDGARLVELRDGVTELTNAFTPTIPIRPFQRDLGPRSPWGRFVRARERVDRLLYAQIAERRRATDQADREDILSMLLAARREDGSAMTDLELRDQLMTLPAAGHQTSASVLPVAFHHPPPQPQVQAPARQGHQRVLGEGPFAAAAIDELPYVDAVLKETLRRRPVIAGIGRILAKPYRIGGIELPEGTLVSPSVYLAHHEPTSWPEPRRFDPTRFLGAQPSPYAYLPFGGGVRRCIGLAFAHYEMRIVLAAVLARFHVHAVRGVDLVPERRGVTIAPSHGMPVVLERVVSGARA